MSNHDNIGEKRQQIHHQQQRRDSEGASIPRISYAPRFDSRKNSKDKLEFIFSVDELD